MNRALNIIVIGLLLVLVYVAMAAMNGLAHKPQPVPVFPVSPAVPVVVTPIVVTPEPVKLRAFVVVGCKDEHCRNPRCPSAPHLAIVKELRDKGWQLTVLDKSEAATLPIEGDKYPYVVVTADGQPMGGKFLTTAFDIGTWLNEQRAGVPGGEWEQAQAEVRPAGLYSLAQVSGGEACPPCMAFARDQHAIEEELGATIDVTHVNLANLPLRVTLGGESVVVESAPTTFLLKDGKPVSSYTGYHLRDGKKAFLSWLAKAEREHKGSWR